MIRSLELKDIAEVNNLIGDKNYIINEYGEALYAVEVHNTPETVAREDEASKILEKIIDILGVSNE